MEMRYNVKAYSVSQINQYIKNMFASDYALSHIYVKGEVSNCKYHTSGHIYFTIKDSKSQMTCVMFAGQRSGLSFQMREGQSVIVFGSITVYERDGKYQMYANEIRPDGAGALYERFEQLKRRLGDEGIFDPMYKKPVPLYAGTVGIVTASTGAAVQDIINISQRRNPYVQLILYPARVQGDGAKDTIVRGIKVLDSMNTDVIIVGRGGGSIEDLWAFNEEEVARAVFECHTPVISAVGHETDVTITDFAADLRAPTPSAGAELAVCNILDVLHTLEKIKTSMNQAMGAKLVYWRSETDKLKIRLEYLNPKNQIIQKRQYLMDMEEKLADRMAKNIEKKRHILALYIEKMKGLSPLVKLNQGYAYAADREGRMLKSITQVQKGDQITVRLADGDITAAVTDIRAGAAEPE